MGWRDHALRLLAKGLLADHGRGLDAPAMIAVFDRIAQDDELSARLDALGEAALRAELIALYEEARDSESVD